MSFIFWLIAVVIAVVIVIFSYVFVVNQVHKLKPIPLWAREILGVITMIFLILVLLSPIYYEFPSPGTSKVARFDDQGKIKYYPYGKFDWFLKGDYIIPE